MSSERLPPAGAEPPERSVSPSGEVRGEHPPSPQPPAANEAPDEVLDAVVLEEPAVLANLPGSRPLPGLLPAQPPELVADVGLAARELIRRWARWLEAQPATHMVPRRFGMSGILGMMTALALLFGLLRHLDAHPATYLFFGLLGLVTGIAQMLNNARPRVASVVAGAILVPLFFGVVSLREPFGPQFVALVCLMPFWCAFGAFLGYAMGTLAAGVFLLMDRLEQWWTDRRGVRPAGEAAAPAAQPPEKAC